MGGFGDYLAKIRVNTEQEIGLEVIFITSTDEARVGVGHFELEKVGTDVLNKFTLLLAAWRRVKRTDHNLLYCSRRSRFHKAPADFKVRRNMDGKFGEGELAFWITKSYSSSTSSLFRPWIRDIDNPM